MRAAVCYAPHDIRVEDIDDPTPGIGEVKVKVGAVGVCHTDMNYFLGAVPVPMPVVLGHEGAGVVVEVGPGVEAITVGDHVICSIIGPCEHCFQCLHDNPGLCENAPFFTGKMLDGTTRLSKGGRTDLHAALPGLVRRVRGRARALRGVDPARRAARRRVRACVRRQHRPRRRARCAPTCNPAPASSSSVQVESGSPP